MIQKFENRSVALKEAISRSRKVLFGHVTYGGCDRCPLVSNCVEANDTDTSCRLARKATEEFLKFVADMPHVTKADMFGIRSLASIYASMIVAEAYFKVYGSVEVSDGNPSFSDLHKQWIRLQTRFQEGLAKYGLTPAGRRLLDANFERSKSNSFEDFVAAKYKIINAESKRTSKHNRVLPGPGAFESSASGDADSSAEDSVWTAADESGDRVVEVDE